MGFHAIGTNYFTFYGESSSKIFQPINQITPRLSVDRNDLLKPCLPESTILVTKLRTCRSALKLISPEY